MHLVRIPLALGLVLAAFAVLMVAAFVHSPSAADAASCVPPGHVDGLNTPSCPPATAVPAQVPVPTGIAALPGGNVQQPGPPVPAVAAVTQGGGQPNAQGGPVTSAGDTAAVTRPQQPQVVVRQPPSVLPATGAGGRSGGEERTLLGMIALGSSLLVTLGVLLVMRSRLRFGAR